MDGTTIDRLRRNSNARVGGSRDFTEIQEDIEKYKKAKGAVKLSEMLDDKKDKKETEKKDAVEKKSAEKKDEDALSIQTKEALEILADLVHGA